MPFRVLGDLASKQAQCQAVVPGPHHVDRALKDEHRNNIRARVFEFTEEEDDTVGGPSTVVVSGKQPADLTEDRTLQ